MGSDGSNDPSGGGLADDSDGSGSEAETPMQGGSSASGASSGDSNTAGTSSGDSDPDDTRPGDDPSGLGPDGFRAIVEGSDDGIVTFDADCRIQYVNPAVESVLKTAADAIVGRTPQELADSGIIAVHTAEEIETSVAAVVSNRDRTNSVERVLEFGGQDGDQRTLELQLTALGPDATAGVAVATVRDVTERRQAEIQLRESRRKIDQLHDAATEIVACRTETEAAERAVTAAEEILEFDVCTLTLKRGEWFVPVAVSTESPDDGVRRYHEDEGLLGKTHRTGQSQRADDVHADSTSEPADDAYRSGISVPIGEVGVFQATATETFAFDQEDIDLAETLMAHVAETIRRINTESELREREEELVAERDRLAALFENVPDPVASFDFEDGEPIVTDINGPFEEVFGYGPEEIVGHSIDDYILPDEHTAEARVLNEALQSGERLQTTSQRKTVDGVRDFLLHVVPIRIGERSVQGYAIYTDITDQKERQRELERQNERLDEFASIVSHDLRNPLSVAEGYLELAAETGEDSYFEEVATAHDRMRRMIDELLALAREGEVVGETGSVELSSAARSAWDTTNAPGIDLAIDGDRTVEADRERLIELFENLFRNTVEHGDGDVTTIRVGTTEDGFFVADDGPGFDAGEPQQVFESGYTTAEDGTGFGLAIVQQIAQAHDWIVEAGESEAGGARFDIRFRS